MISVVVPAYNERENLTTLVQEITTSLSSFPFEIVIIDDGSTDGTPEMFEVLKHSAPSLKAVRLKERGGKTRAIQEGFYRCEGDSVVLIDGDLQYSPEDIPRLLQELDSADVVNGERTRRRDPMHRQVASVAYNALVNALFSLRFNDSNSGLKVFRRQTLERIIGGLRPGWHRYLLAIANADGARITEVPINHLSRLKGQSKFSSPFRFVKGLFDLLYVAAYVRSSGYRQYSQADGRVS